MRFMLIVKASRNSEGANRPHPELEEAMSRYNEELEQAGVRILAEGLHPSAEGLRIAFPIPGGKPVVTQGPFPEPETLVAGFILLEVASRAEAVEWAMKMPDPQGDGEGQIELRQIFEWDEETQAYR